MRGAATAKFATKKNTENIFKPLMNAAFHSKFMATKNPARQSRNRNLLPGRSPYTSFCTFFMQPPMEPTPLE
jgi:hypothetical protein